MKKIFKYTLACIPALFIMACNPAEEAKSDLGSIADINSIEYSIVTDPEDGTVMYFNILTPGVVGIWDFERPISTIKTGVDFTMGFAFRGTYAVNLSVYNKGGISQSKRIEFEVPESNPLLAEAFDFLTAKPWVWDNTNAGHLGNGPAGETGPSWWVAGPNEQDPRVYDDTLKFHMNQDYDHITLDYSLVNEDAAFEQWGVSPKPAASAVLPYTPPAGQTWNLTAENGVKYLSFGGNGFPAYCPCPDWGSKKYAIIQLDENILSIRIDFDWGAFYMRFKHPS